MVQKLMRVFILVAGLVAGCDDEGQPVEAIPSDAPNPCVLGEPADSAHAQILIEELYSCEGSELTAVSCSEPTDVWTAIGAKLDDGRRVVGRTQVDCTATAVALPERSFSFTLDLLTLPPPNPPGNETGLIRCLRESVNQSRFRQCQLPPEEWAVQLNTPEKLREHTLVRLECADCALDEYQVDCWGPWASSEYDSWTNGCRIYDRVSHTTLVQSLPFEPLR